MLVTVTNTSGRTINDLDKYFGPFGVPYAPSADAATGGQRRDPLPYPFGHIGALLNAGTKQLPMHPADWHYKGVPWLPTDPRDEWQRLVQEGVVTLAIVVEPGAPADQEEKFLNLV